MMKLDVTCKNKQVNKFKMDLLKRADTSQNGITLIALVITIVILIILAGVTINLTVGDNGIFSKAKEARKQHEIADAREKIEIAMIDIQTEKISKNEDYTVDVLVKELPNKVNGITIEKEGDIAKGTYKGYNFTISQNLKLAIEGESLIVTANTEIKEYIGKDANNKYAANVLVTIETEGNIDKIEIENTDGTVTKETVGNNRYSKELKMELDKEYKVNITSENGRKTSKKISISSTKEIANVEQLVAFRNNVNSGLTYEGVTINLTEDIDLSSVCYKVDGTIENDVSWEPIGIIEQTICFKGNFEGNNKTIKNLYINVDKDYQGLFAFINSATIQNLNVRGNITVKGSEAAGIVNNAGESKILNCKSYVELKQNEKQNSRIGGIINWATNTTIENCENYGNILTYGQRNAGIVAMVGENTEILNCVNYGNIKETLSITDNTNSFSAGIVGAVTDTVTTVVVKNCINNGEMSGGNFGGICGKVPWGRKISIENSYNTKSISANYYAGGIIAFAENTSTTSINNSYNKGLIQGTISNAIISKQPNANINMNNVYYLNTSCANGGEGTSKTAIEFETLASSLGENWQNDERNLNGKWKYNEGFPILKWQLKK